MPMIDLCIPEGALAPDAEQRLLRELAELLIRLEGFDPENERARAVTWTFLHRPQVFVAGEPVRIPRYRIVLAAPEGQYDAKVRSAVVREVAEAFARAEGTPFDEVSKRVWVFPIEVPDGAWGSRGQVQRLPDIMAFLAGEGQRKSAERKLEDRDRVDAARVLAAAFDAVAQWP
jgi:phenylpyruvate tautomerase PptA (4-oxalocrotonate tautomerase family)